MGEAWRLISIYRKPLKFPSNSQYAENTKNSQNTKNDKKARSSVFLAS